MISRNRLLSTFVVFSFVHLCFIVRSSAFLQNGFSRNVSLEAVAHYSPVIRFHVELAQHSIRYLLSNLQYDLIAAYQSCPPKFRQTFTAKPVKSLESI